MKLFKIFLIITMLSLPFPAKAMEDNAYKDPLAPLNRTIFTFNTYADHYVINPLIRGYRFLLPDWTRHSITNFVRNLNGPVIIANQLLQGDLKGFGLSTTRFIVNSLLGLGGFIDLAAREGFHHEEEDFGQTLAVWGVADGPYLVLPLIGGTSLRDGLGRSIDQFAFNPIVHYARNVDEEKWTYYDSALRYLVLNDVLLEAKEDIYLNAFDPYTSYKSMLYQQRQMAIIDRKKMDDTYAQDIPDYEEF